MIVDIHAHIFPYLGGACGYRSVSAHLARMSSLYRPQTPVNKGLETSQLPDVNFRVGKFGRFEWTENGIDYYRQFNPPSLQDQSASSEFMLAQMDHAGVDIAVLQNGSLYGKLNKYFSECVNKYPDKFVGLAEANVLNGHSKREISKLQHAIKNLKLKGLYLETISLFFQGILDKYTDKKLDIFWREVSDLGISVHWGLSKGTDSAEQYLQKLKMVDAWSEKFPDIPLVIVHGLFPIKPFMKNNELNVPKEFLALFKHSNISAEILFPVIVGPLGWDYPYPQAQRIVKVLYEEVGAEKLVWGSDMPVVECNCTYKQSLNYLKNYCDFISPKDMDLILGGNAMRILKIKADVPRTTRPKKVGGIY